ncbi:MAG: VapE family protein, partial [Alphaproteobacteria bacterium]
LGGMVSILDEIGAGMDYAQAEAWTNLLTETNDEFRVAFAHWPIAKPRMTVFVGTSNDLQLKDPTGSRRFLVMQLRSINWDRANAMLEDARFLQQCYAEAWHDVMVTGEEWWLSPEQDAIRARENQRHETTTEDIAALEGYFNLVYDRRYRDVWLTTSQIFAGLGIKYSPAKARNAETYLREVEGIDYRDRYENEKGRILYRVWEFPATSEFELRATGS